MGKNAEITVVQKTITGTIQKQGKSFLDKHLPTLTPIIFLSICD